MSGLLRGILHRGRLLRLVTGVGAVLETRHVPDAPNRPEFPSVVPRPSEMYASATVFAFAAR